MLDPRFFLATVVSNEDPALRGRVRIRIMGVHTEITQPTNDMLIGIAEKDLPLAQCMYPVTYSGTTGTCPPPSLQPGDWVLGISLDGPTYQNLMVLGLAKAKFNAEALADGSINAEDAFSSVKKPMDETEAAKAAEKAEEVKAQQENRDATSRLEQYNNSRGPEYQEAAKIAEDWKQSGGGLGSYGAGPEAAAGIPSTGTAIFNILSSLDQNGDPLIAAFRSNSELSLNTAKASEEVKDIVEEGYYSYCWNYYNTKTSKVSTVLPTFAFNAGCGIVDELLEAYGDPRKSTTSYAQFYNNMKNDGKTNEAAYFAEVVTRLNKNGTDKTTLTDSNLLRFNNHQYRLSSQILNKSLRLLGDVVFPTLRSTVTQTQQMLPYYCVEGNISHEHIGVDLATKDIPILAFADGTVQEVMTAKKQDCNSVVILHKGGIKTLYMHMNSVAVKKGQKVSAGQKIGIGGGAGVNGPNTHNIHLHFAVKKETKIIDPVSFFKKDIGFAVNVISTAEHYKKGPLNKTDEAYRDLQKERNETSIPWSF